MERICDYSLLLPAGPVTTMPDPADFASLPRRTHAYLGETVHLLLRIRATAAGDAGSPWRERVSSLCATAAAYAAEGRRRGPGVDPTGNPAEEEECESAVRGGGGPGQFRQCSPLYLHHQPAGDRSSAGGAVKSALVLDEQVVFCLTVSLDKLPVNTVKAKIVATVWRQEEERVEVKEHGYLALLQLRSPSQTFSQDLDTFKAQVSTTLDVLPPPSVQCQQLTVSGKHLTILKVLNSGSQEDVCVKDVRILPNYNQSYLPMMPDGSVLIVDTVCHQSAEVTMASFCRMDSKSWPLPSTLSALEEQNFLFQLHLQEKAEEDSCEGLEVPLVAVLQWCSPALPFTRYISTWYSLPSICLDRPRLVMTASCPAAVRPLEPFWVKYTLLNNLQDFLQIRLIWNSEAEAGGQRDPRTRAVVCQSPVNNLGRCRKGSTVSFSVAFQILRTGLFELSQHMKMKLQFTASVSTPPRERRSPHRSQGPGVRELLERQSLGRSQSFSHHQPTRSHHARTGSVLAFPARSPTGSPISLDKIVKRECKVLVLDPSSR